MASPPTKLVRVIAEGLFDKLMEKITNQFIDKHGFKPAQKDVAEAIAKATIDNKLF